MRTHPVYGYWTMAAAARELGVSRGRVTQMLSEGKLARVWNGGRSYVSGYSLRALLQGRAEIERLRNERRSMVRARRSRPTSRRG